MVVHVMFGVTSAVAFASSLTLAGALAAAFPFFTSLIAQKPEHVHTHADVCAL